jgi:pimeloyl-ACP methyl ester carboxylesterase
LINLFLKDKKKMKGIILNSVLISFLFSPVLVSGQPSDFRKDLLLYKDKNGNILRVKNEEEWMIRRGQILDSLQLVMGPLPPVSRKVSPDMKVINEEHIEGIRRLKITFAAERNDMVPAYLFIPPDITTPVPGVLCLHQTIKSGKAEPAGITGSPDLHYAIELAKRGYVTLAPDYPNFGDYVCDPYARHYVSATMKGIWNHMAAVDLLQSLPEVDKNRIGCIGHSLGGHNSLFLAVFDTRVKAVVTSCGFTSFFKYYGGDLTGWSHKGYMPLIADKYNRDPQMMPFDFAEILGAIAPRALFINAPLRDSNFDVSGVRDCVSAAKKIYDLYGAADRIIMVNPDAPHNFPPVEREAAYRFLDSELDFVKK